MAITRAQQAKQMLQNGGRIGFFRGAQADASAGKGAMSPGTSTSGGGRDVGGDDFGQFERRIRQNQELQGAGFLGKDLGMNIGEQSSLAKFGDVVAGLPSIKFIRSLRDILPQGTRPVTTPVGGGGDSQAMASAFIPAYIRAGFNTQEEYDEFLASQKEDEAVDDKIERSLAFRADGGPIGGEFDFESARQMYGLGKLVKKVTKTVKKIAKSPIGKAALLYTGIGGLGNMAAGQSFFSNFASPSTFLGGARNIFSTKGIKNILVGAPGEFLGSPRGPNTGIFTKGTRGIFGTGGEFNPFTTTAAISLLGALTPEEELQAQELADSSTDFDLEKARNSILAAKREQYMMDVRARGFKADGGRIEYQEGSKEPVAKKTMPLLDMGGKEMDLREEGGFVPIGRMEKADDVPARLSKNEFVFTADAVRNAGDGDVDKGAEVMYNMMKNLEAGGEVSEESQGLEGARKMFQTSQRLEEVL